MPKTDVVKLHDEALLAMPHGASHDDDGCPICRDWALQADGTRAGMEQEERPFGEVEYADNGLIDGVHRWPIDSEYRARKADGFIREPEVAKKYSSDELKAVQARIDEALSKFGAESAQDRSETQDEVSQPEGGVSMETLTKETHEALLDKAVNDAVSQREAELAELTSKHESAQAAIQELTEKVESLTAEAKAAGAELDKAQVSLRESTERVGELESEIARQEEEAKLNERALERAKQVRNLGLFEDTYVEEKASHWARLDDEEWAERVEELKAVRSTDPKPTPPIGDVETASAFTGSSESGAADKATPRRAVLGLAAN